LVEATTGTADEEAGLAEALPSLPASDELPQPARRARETPVISARRRDGDEGMKFLHDRRERSAHPSR
jgi:hypothetical protein